MVTSILSRPVRRRCTPIVALCGCRSGAGLAVYPCRRFEDQHAQKCSQKIANSAVASNSLLQPDVGATRAVRVARKESLEPTITALLFRLGLIARRSKQRTEHKIWGTRPRGSGEWLSPRQYGKRATHNRSG